MPNDTNEAQVDRKPVQVELVVKRDEQKVSVFQKVKGWAVTGLAGGAIFATFGSIVASKVFAQFTGDVSRECEPFVKSALSVNLNQLLLVQGALLAAGFILFFLVAMFWRRSKEA